MRPPSFRADADEDIHAMALQQAGLWTAGDAMGRAVRRARHHLPHAPLLPASTAIHRPPCGPLARVRRRVGLLPRARGPRPRRPHRRRRRRRRSCSIVLAASELSVADVDTDVPGSALHDRLAPMDREGDIADGPALMLQATRFACSGIALGMRMAHALIDGVGAARTCHHRALPMDAAV